MARCGWSTANFLRYASGLLTAAPLTVAAWCNTSITATGQRIFQLGLSTAVGSNDQFSMSVNGLSDTIDATTGGPTNATAASTSTAISANVWFHACAVFASATDRRAFLNGGGKGTNTTSKVPSGINRTSIGRRDNASGGLAFAPSGTGHLAEVAVWNIALSDTDVAALATGIHPFLIHPEALVAYWPLIGAYSPEINLKSNAAVMTMQGTLTASPHPRIFMPPRPRFTSKKPSASASGFNHYYDRFVGRLGGEGASV